jgi:hypothetical protein
MAHIEDTCREQALTLKFRLLSVKSTSFRFFAGELSRYLLAHAYTRDPSPTHELPRAGGPRPKSKSGFRRGGAVFPVATSYPSIALKN